MKNLYYFERIMGHQLTPPIMFPCKNIEQIVLAIVNFEELFHNIFRKNALQAAYNEFKDSCATFETHRSKELVERRARSYFVELAINLAHWDEYINHRTQKPNLQQLFKSLRDSARKSCREYTIAKWIRNYAVHFDEITNRVHVNSGGAEFYFMRDNLLNLNNMQGTQNRKNVQKLRQLPKEIALIPVIDKSYEALMKIHGQLMDFLIDEKIQEDCRILIEVYSKIALAGLENKIWKIFDGFESLSPTKPAKIVVLDVDWRGYLAVASYIKDREASKCLTQ